MPKHIVTAPNAILRTKSAEVDVKQDAALIKKYLVELEETLRKKDHPKGVGLALPQLGKNLRMFTTLLPKFANKPDTEVYEDDEEIGYPQTYINPHILETSTEKTLGPDPKEPLLEGCLSLPNLYGPVPRFTWIRIAYINRQFEVTEETLYGFAARVVQHEYDHLDGILFTDHIAANALPIYEYTKGKMRELDPVMIKPFART